MKKWAWILAAVLLLSGCSASPEKSSGKNGAVTVMTMHGSKGLEFPICIIAELEKELEAAKKKSMENGYCNS